MIIWRDVPVKIKEKQVHIKKIGGRIYNSFIVTYGDIPVININEITGKMEEVFNNRGRAYAARRRLAYRSKKD